MGGNGMKIYDYIQNMSIYGEILVALFAHMILKEMILKNQNNNYIKPQILQTPHSLSSKNFK